jgi:hypothetical protein
MAGRIVDPSTYYDSNTRIPGSTKSRAASFFYYPKQWRTEINKFFFCWENELALLKATTLETSEKEGGGEKDEKKKREEWDKICHALIVILCSSFSELTTPEPRLVISEAEVTSYSEAEQERLFLQSSDFVTRNFARFDLCPLTRKTRGSCSLLQRIIPHLTLLLFLELDDPERGRVDVAWAKLLDETKPSLRRWLSSTK